MHEETELVEVAEGDNERGCCLATRRAVSLKTVDPAARGSIG